MLHTIPYNKLILRNLFTFCILLISALSSLGQFIDRAPSGKQNCLVIEGGGRLVNIDSTTSLDTLIARLSNDWQFIETGKMYWIGYTEDMFSIAARRDIAIQPLVNLLENSSNEHAKYGAIYSLHLIGIDRKIIGRFSEKFVNPKARKALLQFLKYPALQADIMRLLIRDPWKSDVPYIMGIMKSCKSDCWALVNGLTRYEIKDLPIYQTIPDNIKNLSVQLKYTNESILESDFDFESQIKEALDSFNHLKSKSISIEDTLFKSKLRGDFKSKFGSPITIEEFFSLLDFNNYLSLGSSIQYYLDGGKLYICSPETAKRKLITWWADQTPEQQASYNKNYR